MATIYDVARRAGVSTYTVSAVLNRSAKVSPELTARVMKAVRELDYTISDVARSLQTGRTLTVGMLIPDIANPFYARVVRGAEERLRLANYTLVLGSTYDDPTEQSRYLSVFRSRRVDGLLVFLAPGDERELRRLVEDRKPAVFLSRVPGTFSADAVTVDNVAAARLAVNHLVAVGRRRIAAIVGHISLSVSRERVTGWRLALRKHKLSAPASYVKEGDGSADSGYRRTLELLDQPEPPTGLFVANFLMMTGALKALKERGLSCPSDVEVVSSDDYDWLDVFEPAISTVVIPSYEMGERAADLLLKRIARAERKPEQVTLPAQLRVRTVHPPQRSAGGGPAHGLTG